MRGYPAETVAEYLDVVPADQGDALRTVRERIVAAIPDAGEHIGYGIAIFDYRGRGLVGLSAAKHHCSLHFMSPPAARALASEITEGRILGATLQFDASSPLSAATVTRIIEYRIAEVDSSR